MSKILLHIGYPKAGSSFLGNWFHKHPDIIFSDFSIGGFNNTQQLMESAIHKTGDSDKIRIVRDMRFTAPDSADFKNIDNIETAQKNIANTLYSLFPVAKVLIVTRGFEAIIKATYSQYIKEGGILKFEQYIEKHKNSNWIPFDYSYVIDLYTDLFGKENILTIPFETLNNDPNFFISQIESFINISHTDHKYDVVNPSLTSKSIELFRKINKIIYFLFYLFGPFQKNFYAFYTIFLRRFKTKSWDNFIIKSMASIFISKAIIFNIPDEIKKRFMKFSSTLKNNPLYNDFKNEYFIF